MHDVLQHRPAWYVLGPLLGLVVLGLLVTINERFGVLGGYSNVVERLSTRHCRGWSAKAVYDPSSTPRFRPYGDGTGPRTS